MKGFQLRPDETNIQLLGDKDVIYVCIRYRFSGPVNECLPFTVDFVFLNGGFIL